MQELRNLLCWLFAITSMICLRITGSFLAGTAFRHTSRRPSLRILIATLYAAQAIVYGAAWWTVWKARPSAKIWGFIASLIYILQAALICTLFLVLPFSHLPGSAWSSPVVILAIGVAGLAAFWRYERTVPAAAAVDSPPIPGDGTSELANRAAGWLALALSVGAFYWWTRWLRTQNLTAEHSTSTFVSIAVVLFTIVTVHELGHTVTGLTLGMKLRALLLGPFHWHIRDGRWRFQFDLNGTLGLGGATGVVPTTADFPRWRYLCMTAAGPLFTLATGGLALWIAFTTTGESAVQVRDLLALFGALSLAICVGNLIPFRTGNTYSDGASMVQLFSEGPWADYRRAIEVVGASLVTPLRPRDYDITAIKRAAQVIAQGEKGMLLRLYAYLHFLDRGQHPEAYRELVEAESVCEACAPNIPAELYTVFVFGNALVGRDATAARKWWARMEAKKPTRLNVDYWLAASALHWIEGHLEEANEAWKKCHAQAQELPRAGAYEFDRYCCALMGRVLDKSPGAIG